MKLTVKERFFDKRESIYVEKDVVIEREDERANELIEAGVAVPFEEDEEEKKSEDEKSEDEKSEDEKHEDEKSEEEKSEDKKSEDEKPEKGKKKTKKAE